MLTGLKKHNVSSCFVSAPAGMDLGRLPRSLSTRGISWEWAKAAAADVANTYAAIRRADVFIGVLNGSRADYRVIHETGVAAALQKPILLIMSPRRKLPVDLSHFSVAHIKLTDDRALGFHLDAFLAAPRRNVFEDRASVSWPVPEPSVFPRQRVGDLIRRSPLWSGRYSTSSKEPVDRLSRSPRRTSLCVTDQIC